MTNTQWVIPCNVKFYNVVAAFDKLDVIDWKQSPNLKKAKKGDVLYIYISAPIKSIQYQCLIKEVNKPKSTIDDSQFVIKGDNYINYGNYMELKLLNKLDDDQVMRYRKQNYTGLFRYIQLFIISNGIDTRYISNNDGEIYKSHMFYWSDKENNRINNLSDITNRFLRPCQLVITKGE